eukprot:786915-Rhodomonas_salina.2
MVLRGMGGMRLVRCDPSRGHRTLGRGRRSGSYPPTSSLRHLQYSHSVGWPGLYPPTRSLRHARY